MAPNYEATTTMRKISILAALAVATIVLTTAAEARPRQAYQPPGWVDVAAQPAYPTAQSNRSSRAARPAHSRRAAAARERREAAGARKASQRSRQALLVDKPQEYVKPSSPTEKLVTREAHERAVAGLLSNGMVRVKTAQGFHITVNPVDAAKFLKFFALLKERGHKVNPAIVGCYSPGGHKPGSNHHIGRACDVQTGWNRAPSFMYHARDLIRRAGLYDGCTFGDCGHVEAVRGLYNRRPNIYAALEKFKSDRSTENYQP